MMDFMTHLPWTSRGNDAVCVIVDRLTKSAHFLTVRIAFTFEEFGRSYIREIVAEVYRALRSTREGWYSCLSVGTTTKFIKCSCGILCLHVSMLRKYTPDPTYVVDWGELVVDANETFEEGPMRIMDSRDQVL